MQAKIPGPISTGPLLSDWFYIAEDGRLIVKTGRVELGQGNQTALLKMTGDELGIPTADLILEMARTFQISYSGSRSVQKSRNIPPQNLINSAP